MRESPHWWIKYSRNGQGFRENTRSECKTVAERLLRQKLSQIDVGEDPRVQKVTFRELADNLQTEYRNNGKRLDRLETSLRHLLPIFGENLAPNIGGDRIEKYKAERKGAGAKTATINRELACLKRALNLGKRHRKVAYVPFIDMLKEPPARQGFFTHAQYIALRQALPEYLRPVVALAYHTGMRLQEVLGLRWDQVDMLSRTIRLSPFQTKNKEPRMVKFGNGELYETLLMQRQVRDTQFPECAWVFFRGGKRIGNFGKSWKTACRRLNLYFIDGYGNPALAPFHDFRRTAARNLRRAGVSQKVIQQIAGWKSGSIFEQHNIVDEADFQDAATRLDGLLAREIGQSTVKAEGLLQEPRTLIH